MHSTPLIRIATTCIALLVSGTACANLISNGGFESTPLTAPVRLAPGSTAMPGWTVINGSIDQQRTIDYASSGVYASEGSQLLDLTGYYGRGGIKSDGFSTTIGDTYTVQFDLGAFAATGSNVAVDVWVNDIKFSSFVNMLDNGKNSDWETKNLSFIATATLTSISFTVSQDPATNNAGVGLDNVIVTAGSTTTHVPEPGAAPLALSGLLGMAWMRRRKK